MCLCISENIVSWYVLICELFNPSMYSLESLDDSSHNCVTCVLRNWTQTGSIAQRTFCVAELCSVHTVVKRVASFYQILLLMNVTLKLYVEQINFSQNSCRKSYSSSSILILSSRLSTGTSTGLHYLRYIRRKFYFSSM